MGKRSRMKKLRRLMRERVATAVETVKQRAEQDPKNLRICQLPYVEPGPDYLTKPSFDLKPPKPSLLMPTAHAVSVINETRT